MKMINKKHDKCHESKDASIEKDLKKIQEGLIHTFPITNCFSM